MPNTISMMSMGVCSGLTNLDTKIAL